ncbi:MAG: ABC transporter permease, partial [Bacteroidaceae bacterium]
MNKIGLIVEREFAERVRKKSFIITTLLMPLFMIALMAAPTLIMLWGKSSAKTVVVVDNTPGQLVGSKLESGETITYQLLSEGTTLGQARSQYSNADQAYAILVIGSDIVDNPQNIQFIMNDASSMSIEENIQRQIQGILRTERLSRYEMDNIDQILSDANLRVSLRTLKNNGQEDEEKGMEATSTSASYIMGLVLGMLLYLILIIYGQQVLQSVIDEKQTRVLDVMVTSCTPFELMMGKILGIAVVAALQIVIWAVLVIGASAFIMPLIMGNAGVDAANAVASAASSSDVMSIVGKFTNVSYLAGLFLELLLYIIGGFLFYA